MRLSICRVDESLTLLLTFRRRWHQAPKVASSNGPGEVFTREALRKAEWRELYRQDLMPR
jgi:hypothetical protein